MMNEEEVLARSKKLVEEVMGDKAKGQTAVVVSKAECGVRLSSSNLRSYVAKLKQVALHMIWYVDNNGNISTANVDTDWHVQIEATLYCNLGPLIPGEFVVLNLNTLNRRLRVFKKGDINLRISDGRLILSSENLNIVQENVTDNIVNLVPVCEFPLGWSAYIEAEDADEVMLRLKAMGETAYHIGSVEARKDDEEPIQFI